VVRPRPLSELTVAEARTQERALLCGRPAVREHVADVIDLTIPGPAMPIPARLYLGAGAASPAPALVWLPGGGWVLGSLEAADLAARALANAARCAVVAIAYRQAPEHPFPSAVDDCFAAVRWVARSATQLGLHATRLAVGGASAGGNLATVVARLARDRGEPRLVLQLLVYPPTDHRAAGDTDAGHVDQPAFDRAAATWCWSHYLGEEGDGDDPRASPLRSPDLRGLPPALVITAEHDALREEGERYADALTAGGVETEHLHYVAPHGFFSNPVSEAAADARRAAAVALRRAFGEHVPRGAQ
jgi:acetyl esterase